jgi:hypothetical protein
VERV